MEEGSPFATIELYIPDGQQVFNPLTEGRQKSLDALIYDTIVHKASFIPSFIPVAIRLRGNCNLDQIQDCLQEECYLELKKRKIAMLSNTWRSICLFVFGAVVLCIWILLQKYNLLEIYSQIISIVGTFALWEAADSFILIRKDLRREYMKAGQIASAEYELSPLEKEKDSKSNF
jgi:hypothetical protein